MKKRKIVVVGASTGGLKALRNVLAQFPSDLPASVFIVMHIGATDSILPEILQRHCALPIKHAEDGEPIAPTTIYVAPSDRHMLVSDGKIRLSRGPKENFTRPAIDPLFRSAAVEYSDAVIGVVLTGALDDGAAGLRAVAACGGFTIVQSPESCISPSMPLAALRAVDVDVVAPLDELGTAIVNAVYQEDRSRRQRMIDRTAIELEAKIALSGQSTPSELDRIGIPSTLTCPDCGGVVWRIGTEKPLRYRCHTGHAFSALSLDRAQHTGVEDALWTAIRRLDERILLAQDAIAMEAENPGDTAEKLDIDIDDILQARQALQKLLLKDK